MNITLAIDKHLLERARKVASARGISLNQLIREELERLTADKARDRDITRLVELLRQQPGDSRGERWSREDAYDRAVLR